MAIGNLLGTKISSNTVNSINYIWAGKTIKPQLHPFLRV